MLNFGGVNFWGAIFRKKTMILAPFSGRRSYPLPTIPCNTYTLSRKLTWLAGKSPFFDRGYHLQMVDFPLPFAMLVLGVGVTFSLLNHRNWPNIPR